MATRRDRQLAVLCVGLVKKKKKKDVSLPSTATAHTPTASIGGQISCNDEPLVSEGLR